MKSPSTYIHQDIEFTIDSVVNNLIPCPPDHRYLAEYGLSGSGLFIYQGQEVIKGVDLIGCVAHKVFGSDGNVINVQFKIPTDDNGFEDAYIPSAPLSGGYVRFGQGTSTLLLSIDTETSALLNKATGFGAVAAIYPENLQSVAGSLRDKYPAKKIILCADNDATSSSRMSINISAREIDALIAYSENAENFKELFSLSGPDAVYQSIMDASQPTGSITGAPPINDGSAEWDLSMWPNRVNGRYLLADMLARVRPLVILKRFELLAICLWVIFTHLIDAFRIAPILVLTSPVRRCGKTTLLELLACLVLRPLPTSNITPAGIFRTVDALCPTLLIDEADTFLAKNEELIGIINSGHTLKTAFVQRMDKGNNVKRYKTFCPKAIAGIGKRSPTITDRSIEIRHHRKRPDEIVEKMGPTHETELTLLRYRIARWAHDNGPAIINTQWESPDLENDRAVDNWSPLLAIAHSIGDEWFDRATQAAIELTSRQGEMRADGEALLRDIKSAFETQGINKMPTKSLIEWLCADEEKPWCTFDRGRPIKPHQLAKLLSDFEIHSKQLRRKEGNLRGYELIQFEDAFARYVPDTSN